LTLHLKIFTYMQGYILYRELLYLLILLVCTGCQISVSSPRTGLWVNRENRCNDCNDWSLKLALYTGRMVRPIPGDGNPWQGSEPKDVWKMDWIICPFVSTGIGDYGFYAGCKHFDYTKKHQKRYWWFPYKEYGEYLTPSARITSDRCDKK